MPYDVKESWDVNLNSTQELSGVFNESVTRVMTVVCDTIEEANDEASVYLQLPPSSSVHPRLGEAFILRNISMNRTSPVMWEATLTYETIEAQPTGMGGSATLELVPWAYPTDITYSTSTKTQKTDFAYGYYRGGSGESSIDGNRRPIVTETKEPYNVPITVSDVQITLKRAFQTFDTSQFYTYINTVNEDTFLGFPPGTLKINSISATPSRFEGYKYWEVTVTILAKKMEDNVPDTFAWFHLLYEKGFKYFAGDQGAANTAITNTSKNQIILNNNGSKLNESESPEIFGWQIYKFSNFKQMGFDVDWQP